jgi:hypothetical protein
MSNLIRWKVIIIIIIIMLGFVPLKYKLCATDIKIFIVSIFVTQQHVSPHNYTPLCVSFPLFLSHLIKSKCSPAHVQNSSFIFRITAQKQPVLWLQWKKGGGRKSLSIMIRDNKYIWVMVFIRDYFCEPRRMVSTVLVFVSYIKFLFNFA